MPGSSYLASAKAYQMHKRYPAGQQTAAQLVAERANLKKARAARGLMHHTNSARYHGLRRSTEKSRAGAASARSYYMRDIRLNKPKPLGARYLSYKSKVRFKRPRITGIPKHFIHRVGPGGYMRRTSWGASRSHSFRKRLTKRSRRFRQQSRWKQRGKRFTPR
jgi:hypothetical protein